MFKTISMAALAALTTLSIGCSGGGDGSASNAADTLTRRQKNEIISTLPIPGARGVRCSCGPGSRRRGRRCIGRGPSRSDNWSLSWRLGLISHRSDNKWLVSRLWIRKGTSHSRR